MTSTGMMERIVVLRAHLRDETAALSSGAALAGPAASESVVDEWAAGVGNRLGRPIRLMFVRGVASLPPTRLSPGAQVDQLILLERMKAHLEFQQLQLLSVMAQDDRSEQQCVVEEIRCALRLSAVAVRSRLELATVLDQSLPRTLAALADGSISIRHAQVMGEAASRLPDVDAHRQLEDHLIGRAPGQTSSDLSRRANRAVHRIDPDGAARRHAVAVDERRLVRQPLEDGMAELRLQAPAAAVAAVWTRLDACARRLGAQDPRTVDQRRADLLIDTLLAGVGTGFLSRSTESSARSATAVPGSSVGSDLPTQQGLAPRIEVVVSLSTLLGLDDQPADLAGYGAITAQVARELAGREDATWRRLVTAPLTGALLDYGRTVYRPPADLRDFVLARDAVCVFPDCNRPGRLSEIDHTIAFDGDEFGRLGETSRMNTAPLCCRHHNAKTRREWSYCRQPDGSYDWTSRRTNRTYNSLLPARWNHPDDAEPEPEPDPEPEPEPERQPFDPVEPTRRPPDPTAGSDDPPF